MISISDSNQKEDFKEKDRFSLSAHLIFCAEGRGILSSEQKGDYISLEDTGGGNSSSCESCGGDGEVECGDCYGSGEVECGECSGNGEVSCDNCSGSGEIECENCSGSGNIEDEEGNEYPIEIEDQENLVYLLNLLLNAEHKINREEIKDYRTVLKEELY